MWQHDASLWTGTDEAKWLGWLDITDEQIAHSDKLRAAVADVKKENFTDILLLGHGRFQSVPRSSCDDFRQNRRLPRSCTCSIRPIRRRSRLSRTKSIWPRRLFIVSSKSGTTLEPNIFKQYFFERVKQTIGADKAGSRFIAITDPGSKMQQVAEADHFRHIFPACPASAAATPRFRTSAWCPARSWAWTSTDSSTAHAGNGRSLRSHVPVEQNPGVLLGIILGTAARNGRDKLTIITSPGISALGAWLEQLVAESTGKQGKGIVPVDREELGSPDVYGNDRVFAYVRLESAPDKAQDAKVAALEQAGHPVVRIPLGDIYDLGQEFFRWEIATAVAGSIIGINAFNQPDVEASKIATRNLTDEYEKTGSLPAEKPILEDGGIKLFTDAENADALAKAAGSDKSLAGYLRAHLKRIGAGDYFALLAYIEMNPKHEALLQKLRQALRDRKRVATCLGFGPRFLHSTGQAYKGGPEQRSVSADHLRRRRRSSGARTRNTPSAW